MEGRRRKGRISGEGVIGRNGCGGEEKERKNTWGKSDRTDVEGRRRKGRMRGEGVIGRIWRGGEGKEEYVVKE